MQFLNSVDAEIPKLHPDYTGPNPYTQLMGHVNP